jgi:hypothetical protein
MDQSLSTVFIGNGGMNPDAPQCIRLDFNHTSR